MNGEVIWQDSDSPLSYELRCLGRLFFNTLFAIDY